MIGTTPARGKTLLVGDAAGLVNPLQGEGIAQAMGSGMAAAEAILRAPGHPADLYRAALADAHLPYHRIAAVAHATLVGRPIAVATVGRALTLPGAGRARSPVAGRSSGTSCWTERQPAGRARSLPQRPVWVSDSQYDRVRRGGLAIP